MFLSHNRGSGSALSHWGAQGPGWRRQLCPRVAPQVTYTQLSCCSGEEAAGGRWAASVYFSPEETQVLSSHRPLARTTRSYPMEIQSSGCPEGRKTGQVFKENLKCLHRSWFPVTREILEELGGGKDPCLGWKTQNFAVKVTAFYQGQAVDTLIGPSTTPGLWPAIWTHYNMKWAIISKHWRNGERSPGSNTQCIPTPLSRTLSNQPERPQASG